jgi:hypothetical protein
MAHNTPNPGPDGRHPGNRLPLGSGPGPDGSRHSEKQHDGDHGSDGYGLPHYSGQPPVSSAPKGLAIASLICGIASLLSAWIPIFNFVALAAGLAAIVLGVVSLVKRHGGKVMAWVGAGLGLAGVMGSIIAILVYATLGAFVDRAHEAEKPAEDQNKPVSVTYIVTTSTPTDVQMSGPTGDTESTVAKDQTSEFTAHADDSLRLSATLTDRKNPHAKVTCEILVDGASVAKEGGEGTRATASCTYLPSFSHYLSEKPSKDVSVEFKVTTRGEVSVSSLWSASGEPSSSNRNFRTAADSSFTVKAKNDRRISLSVQGGELKAGDPVFGCEILVDGKSVSKQESTTSFGIADCTYDPKG